MPDTTLTDELAGRKLAPYQITARRIIEAARRPKQDPLAVMASPPTRTEGTAGAASTINGNAKSAATFKPDNTSVFDFVSQPIYYTGSQYRTDGKTAAGTTKQGVYAYGVRVCSNALSFDVDVLRNTGRHYMIYVTDLITGVRARVAANDFYASSGDFNRQYDKFVFSARAPRLIEYYCSDNNQFHGMNFETGAAVWKPERVEPRIGILGDSWMDTTTSPDNTTDKLKNMFPDWFAHFLGANNLLRMAANGAGWLNGSGSSISNHLLRGQNGDYETSLLGELDLVFAFTGTNDDVSIDGAFTDVAVAANITATIQLLKTAQPKAIILVPGPQWATSRPTSQQRFDAVRDAVIAGAAGDPRVIHIDNSPAGENWINAGNVGTLLGTDALHPNNGKSVAHVAASSVLRKLKALAA